MADIGVASIEYLVMGVVLGLSAGMSPGPLMALVVAQAVRHGAGEGIKAAIAPIVTDAPIIAVALFALIRFAAFQGLLGIISVIGGLYVFRLAYETFKSRSANFSTSGDNAPRSLVKGVLVNLLSPNPYIFWLTVGGPAVLRGASRTVCDAVLFIAGFYACLVGAKIVVAVIAAKTRRLISGRAYGRIMSILAALLAVFAVRMIIGGIMSFSR